MRVKIDSRCVLCSYFGAAGATVDHTSASGQSPLQIALYGGRVAVARALLAAGALTRDVNKSVFAGDDGLVK